MTFIPTEGFQLAFLKKLQRLFNEGQFTATYKFALLNAIADLAVEAQDDSDGAMTLSLKSAIICSLFSRQHQSVRGLTKV